MTIAAETMPRSPLSRAFANPYNLILLLAGVGFSWALESWAPAAVAGALEVVWLIVGVSGGGRRSFAGGEAELRRRPADPVRPGADLGEPYAGRVQALEWAANETRKLARQGGLHPAILGPGEAKIEALVQSFVKMATLHQRLSRFLYETQHGNHPQQEMARLTQELEQEKNAGVRLSLRQALALAQRRGKQLEQMEGATRALEVKMSTLEMSFDFLRSQIVGGASQDEVAAALEELVTGTSFVRELEAETGVSLQRVLGTGTYQTVS
jgi:hypothetical protein